MERILEYVINDIIDSTGKIIGRPLAIRYISEHLESTVAMNKEVTKFKVSKKGVDVGLELGIPEKRCIEILFDVINSMQDDYRSLIGDVILTIVRHALDSASEKFGKDHPELIRMTNIFLGRNP